MPALPSRRELHRALITREPAAAGDCFERHGLAAFACCDLCLLYLDDGGRHDAPAGSSTCTTPKNQAVSRTTAPQICLRREQALAGAHPSSLGSPSVEDAVDWCRASWPGSRQGERRRVFVCLAKGRGVLSGFLDENSAHPSRRENTDFSRAPRLSCGKSTQCDADETADPLDQ